MIILIIIAAQLWGANGFLHPAIENINLYVRGLRNTHAPLFHQSYDNYLQLLPGYSPDWIKTRWGKRKIRMETTSYFYRALHYLHPTGSKFSEISMRSFTS